MQFIAIFLLIIILSLIIFLGVIPIDGKLKNELSNTISSNKNKNQNIAYGENNPNSKSLTINNNVKGTLIVKIMINNKDGGNKSSQDFKVNIHANDPIPSSFDGNSSGTTVKLGMGMYSITEFSSPEYTSHYSSDCFGGIMSTDNKECIIINTYDASSIISK
jgi:lipopolysaccharide export LptBFGC system permease protein LptF